MLNLTCAIPLVLCNQKTRGLYESLGRLESLERSYTRSLADLTAEQRKYSNLQERKKLDLSDEIEKVEIALAKCASQLGYRRTMNHVDFCIAVNEPTDRFFDW